MKKGDAINLCKLILIFLILMLVACTELPASVPGVPVSGDSTSMSQVKTSPQAGQGNANGITIAYDSPGSPENETIQQPTPENDLVRSSWQLTSFDRVGVTNPVIGNLPISFDFGQDRQAGGHGGCNSYGKPYKVQNDSLLFGESFLSLLPLMRRGTESVRK